MKPLSERLAMLRDLTNNHEKYFVDAVQFAELADDALALETALAAATKRAEEAEAARDEAVAKLEEKEHDLNYHIIAEHHQEQARRKTNNAGGE
jgi:hypothetical protein